MVLCGFAVIFAFFVRFAASLACVLQWFCTISGFAEFAKLFFARTALSRWQFFFSFFSRHACKGGASARLQEGGGASAHMQGGCKRAHARGVQACKPHFF